MNLVLAVEPDSGQAERLRRIAKRLNDVELILVDSAEAVAPTLSSRVPRLLLLGASLSEQSRALAVDHYILASDASDPPVLAIPPLSNGQPPAKGKKGRKSKTTAADADVFIAAIGRCLAAFPLQPQAESLSDPEMDEEVFLEIDSLVDLQQSIDPAAHAAALASAQALADARLTTEVERVRREADARHAADLDRLKAEAKARHAADLTRLKTEAQTRHAAAVERLKTEAQIRLAAAVDDARAQTLNEARTATAAAVDQAVARVRAEAAEQLAAQLAEADRLHSAAAERTQTEIERITSGSAEQLDVQLRRAREEIAAAAARAEAAETARARATAAAEAVRVETELRHEAALSLAQGEIEAARQALQAAQREAESMRLALTDEQAARHAAMEQARVEADRDSRARTDEAVRTEAKRAEAALAEAVRAEAKRAEAVLAEAVRAEALRAEAVRVDAEERHRAELERARHELSQIRLEMEQARAAHLSANEQSRADAERDNRARVEEAVHAEAMRAEAVRIETDRRHQAELERAHQELNGVRQEMEQARAAHRSAIEQLRADAERDDRSRAEEALRTETARINADGRHREELERARQELNHTREEIERARAAHLSAIEQARAEAERDSRAWAEETIRATTAQLTADADARIASEVAAAMTEAEERRVAGLVALRAQLDQLTGKAGRADIRESLDISESVVPPAPAPVAIEVEDTAPVAAEVESTAFETAPPAPPAATLAIRQVMQVAARGGRLAAHGLRIGGQTALPVARRIIERVPRRAAAAAILLLVVGGFALANLSALTQRGTSAASYASRKAASLFGLGAPASEEKTETAVAAEPTADEAPVAVRDAPPATSGLLQVYSRVPMDVYVAGKRIGTTGDRELALPPGRHRVEFVSERLNYRGEATINIRSAAFTTHNVQLPMGSLLIETEPGAEIIVEGQPAGVAPVGVVSAPLGTAEVVIRHPERGERREVVEVRHGVTTELRVPFPPADGPVADVIPPA